MTATGIPSVSKIMEIFESNNTDAKVDFLEKCPNSTVLENAKEYIKQPYLEVNLGALNMLAETYSRGIDCHLGVVLSEAIYHISQKAITTIFEKKLRDAYLFCAGSSLHNWLLGLNGLGRYQDSVEVGEEKLNWLKNKSYEESLKHQCILCLSLIEAYLGLAHGNNYKSNEPNKSFLIRAQELLNETKKINKTILNRNLAVRSWTIMWCIAPVRAELKYKAVQLIFSKFHKAYHSKLEQLENKYNQLIQKATNLPVSPERKTEQEQKQFDREISQNLNVLKESLKNIEKINPKLVDRFKSITESLETLKQQSSSNSAVEKAIADRDANKQESSPSSFTSAGEKAIANRDLMDRLSDFLSGYELKNNSNEAQKIQLQKKIRNACLIFTDPIKGRDQIEIQKSLTVLQEARRLARQNYFIEDENDALWGLYLCYSRSQQEDLAIESLQSLRRNLESLRSKISDPMKRAGIFTKFPYLFASLCQLLCRAGRSEELLEAVEGAKGRVLADVLTESRGEIIEDSTFTEPVKYLPELMQQVHAHYLSYFVDDESTYAVLVAKDGSMYSQEITLGKETLREWSKEVNPKPWGTTTYNGEARIDIPDDLPDRLAKLVSWLEPFAKSGLIKQEDHICYCPDEELHLIPLHYVTFLNEPLVKYVSLSRIYGASALVSILKQSPGYFSQAIAIQVPYEHEKSKSQKGERFHSKLQQLDLAPKWLVENLLTQYLKEEKADLQALRNLNLRNKLIHFSTHGIFPHKDKSFSGKDENPYTNSGLMLAAEEKLPVRNVMDAKNPNVFTKHLLTPKKILDKDINPNLNFSESHISLMACVSGLSKEGIGGDALGLEWAFLLAGASSLLGTHWNVPAAAAAEFSLRFYDKWLNQRFPRYAAWRETVLELMSYEWKLYKHCSTYYWAAFSLTGDWR